ncbi:MAG: alpha/beta hydrolase domain-containing protein [Gammaproteobacteria bacterium]
MRYEVSVNSADNNVDIAGGDHLSYYPTEAGLRAASLTRRQYQTDPRVPVERSSFELDVRPVPDSNQPSISLRIDGGFEPGVLYELIYQARDPVLSAAGMTAIRDMVSAIRYGGTGSNQFAPLDIPEIEHTVAYGFSQSGRLLRQYLYDGFNADQAGRIVFDGMVPFIAGGGYGMFNLRFAMPTRTNGHHSNYLYPNDLFPFTYGESTDPFTGRSDSLLGRARASNTVPRVMHIQTSNEYWLRAGSLPHTNPQGTADAVIPDEVRFYTIGGSQHGSGDGRVPGEATGGQLPRNPNMWSPIGMSLVKAMYDWVADGVEPPSSVYPKIADGTLVPSHVDGRINRAAWNGINGYRSPTSMYQPVHASYGSRWDSERIIDSHPDYSDHFYRSLVPAVDANNNDLAAATILPPLTSVPLATFVSWNLRNPATGAERSLARLSGGYIPFAKNTFDALANRDQRDSVEGLYASFQDYHDKYRAAVSELIERRFLLPGFMGTYMQIAHSYENQFE